METLFYVTLENSL